MRVREHWDSRDNTAISPETVLWEAVQMSSLIRLSRSAITCMSCKENLGDF